MKIISLLMFLLPHVINHVNHVLQVAPQTIHPAHEKAASYFGFKIIHVPVKDDYRPDMKKYAEVRTDVFT